jgi:hypothetical protein
VLFVAYFSANARLREGEPLGVSSGCILSLDIGVLDCARGGLLISGDDHTKGGKVDIVGHGAPHGVVVQQFARRHSGLRVTTLFHTGLGSGNRLLLVQTCSLNRRAVIDGRGRR